MNIVTINIFDHITLANGSDYLILKSLEQEIQFKFISLFSKLD